MDYPCSPTAHLWDEVDNECVAEKSAGSTWARMNQNPEEMFPESSILLNPWCKAFRLANECILYRLTRTWLARAFTYKMSWNTVSLKSIGTQSQFLCFCNTFGVEVKRWTRDEFRISAFISLYLHLHVWNYLEHGTHLWYQTTQFLGE